MLMGENVAILGQWSSVCGQMPHRGVKISHNCHTTNGAILLKIESSNPRVNNMPQHQSIQSHYQSCDAVVYADGGKQWLNLTYKAPVNSSCQLGQLYNAIDGCVSDYNNSRKGDQISYSHTPIEQVGSDNSLSFRIYGKGPNGIEVPMNTAALKELRHFLKTGGVISDAQSVYMRDVGDGVVNPSALPSPATVPSSAPSPQIIGPAISPSIQNQSGQLALIPIHYKEAKPLVGNNSLSLHYTMNGPVNFPTVVTNYNYLKATIEHSTRLISTRPDGSELVAHVSPLSSQAAAGGGLAEARFTVQFHRKSQSSTKRLQQQDMSDISKSLQLRQLLTGQEVQELNSQMIRAMGNSGWSRTP